MREINTIPPIDKINTIVGFVNRMVDIEGRGNKIIIEDCAPYILPGDKSFRGVMPPPYSKYHNKILIIPSFVGGIDVLSTLISDGKFSTIFLYDNFSVSDFNVYAYIYDKPTLDYTTDILLNKISKKSRDFTYEYANSQETEVDISDTYNRVLELEEIFKDYTLEEIKLYLKLL